MRDHVLDLESTGYRLWIEGERLRCQAPAGQVPADVREALLANRDAVIAFLRHRVSSKVVHTPGELAEWLADFGIEASYRRMAGA